MTGTALVVRPPLTPPDCDLRDFGHMPLDVRKFRDSDLVALEDADAIVAAIMLWGAAWHQVPAASLPDDDRVLSQLAGYGKVVKEWRKVRDGALRGFVKCSDGRLYHPLVAEKARTAWEGKLKQRWRTYCSAIRMHNSRNPEDERTAPAFDAWEDSGRPQNVTRQAGQKPREPDLFEEDENGEESRATGDDVARNGDDCSPAVARRIASKGKGKGERKGKGKRDSNNNDNGSETHPEPVEDLLALTARIAAAAGVSVIQPTKLTRALDIVRTWRADEIPTDLVLDVIAKRLADMPERETVSSLAYFDAPIRKAHSLKGNPKRVNAEPPPALTVTDDEDPRIAHIRQSLRSTLGPATYDGWLGPKVAAFSLNGSSVTITTPSQFMADWVSKHFRTAVASAAGVPDVVCKVMAQ